MHQLPKNGRYLNSLTGHANLTTNTNRRSRRTKTVRNTNTLKRIIKSRKLANLNRP
jgi:hypothetical protein